MLAGLAGLEEREGLEGLIGKKEQTIFCSVTRRWKVANNSRAYVMVQLENLINELELKLRIF